MSENEFLNTENFAEEKADCQEQSANANFQSFNTANPYNFSYTSFATAEFLEKEKEKKEIKKAARAAGISFLSGEILVTVISFIIVFVLEILKEYYFFSTSILEDPAMMHVLQVFLSSIIYTLPFIITYKICGYRISSLVSYKRSPKRQVLPFFLFGVGFCTVANIASGVMSSFFSSFGIEYEVNYHENPEGIFGLILVIISTVITPALVEEFACRGIILGSLRKFGDGFAIIVSSILFGLMHGNFEQIPFAFLVGLILGFVTVKSGSLRIAMMIHAFNNALSVALSYLLPYFPTELQDLVYIGVFSVLMLLSVLGLGMLKTNEDYKLEEAKTRGSEKEKYKWFFTGIFIIIFIIVCFISSLSFFVG